jgi:hypothetical protein
VDQINRLATLLCCSIITNVSSAVMQWVLHNTGDLRWTFRSVSSGHYLGLDGNAADGTRLVTVSFPVEWGVLDQAHNYGGDPSLCMCVVQKLS